MIEANLQSFGESPAAEKLDIAIGMIERAQFDMIMLLVIQAMVPQVKDFRSGANIKGDMSSFMQTNGESENYPNQRIHRRQNRVKKGVQIVVNKEEEIRQEMMAAGIFLCPVRCPRSLHYCVKPGFLTEANRDKHVACEKHIFPRGFNATNCVIEMASSVGGLMILGTHKDRKKTSQTSTKSFPSSVACQEALDACCFEQFHRRTKKETYQKPRRLQEELERIFAMRPKQTAQQARQIMKAQIDPKDGGLMFCWSKRGEFMAKSDPRYKDWKCSMCGQSPFDCNGVLLSEEQITAAFSTRSSKEKKDGAEKKDYSEARGHKKS